MYILERAKEKDVEMLNDLAVKAQTCPLSNSRPLKSSKETPKITKKYLNNNLVFLYRTEKGSMMGYYSIGNSEAGNNLDCFYVHPKYVVNGFGEYLWHCMIDTCNEFDIFIDLQPQPKYDAYT